ncbi:MAG: DUF1223 domain-containing protein [Pseudomonadota bacterium]|nr:DUF1223 domain-containing protein [Pseudomonadota bacterium]
MRHPIPRTSFASAALGLAFAGSAAAAGMSCQAQSPELTPTVIELYTSEGCSSCPPADRWLSSVKTGPEVVALAFHVDYWDRLGWVDRFATPAATQRQYQLARLAGHDGVYTPQVVVSGQDWRSWPKLPAASVQSPVSVTLTREGNTVTAQVAPARPSGGRLSAQLSGYWAVLEDRHQTQVRAGENSGETLRHDHVVRQYQPVSSWGASEGAKLMLTVSPGVPDYPRQVVFVVTDPSTAKPLQAVSLGC